MVLDEHLQCLYGKGNLVADLRIAVLYYRSVKIYCYCHLVPKQIVSPCKGSGNFLLFIHLCSKGVGGLPSLPCQGVLPGAVEGSVGCRDAVWGERGRCQGRLLWGFPDRGLRAVVVGETHRVVGNMQLGGKMHFGAMADAVHCMLLRSALHRPSQRAACDFAPCCAFRATVLHAPTWQYGRVCAASRGVPGIVLPLSAYGSSSFSSVSSPFSFKPFSTIP